MKNLFITLLMLLIVQCKAPEPQPKTPNKMEISEIQDAILGLSDEKALIFFQELYSTEKGRNVLSKIKGFFIPQIPIDSPMLFSTVAVQMIKDDTMILWMPIIPSDFGDHNPSNISLGSLVMKETTFNTLTNEWEVSQTFTTGVTVQSFSAGSGIPYLMKIEVVFSSSVFTGRNKRYYAEINTVTGTVPNQTPYKTHRVNLFTN